MVHGARLGVGAAAVEQLDQLARAVLELGEPLAKVGHHHRGRREGELGSLASGARVDPRVVLDRAQDDVERTLRVALDGLAQLDRAPVRLEQVGRHGDEHGGRLRDVPWDVLDLVEAEPVEEGLVPGGGQG